MRWMILRMIATGSLSAFSAPALQGPGAVSGGVVPVRTVRTPAAPAQGALPALGSAPASTPQPGRTPPRGSLLDISV